MPQDPYEELIRSQSSPPKRAAQPKPVVDPYEDLIKQQTQPVSRRPMVTSTVRDVAPEEIIPETVTAPATKLPVPKPLTFKQGEGPVTDQHVPGVRGLMADRYQAPASISLGERQTAKLAQNEAGNTDALIHAALSKMGPEYPAINQAYKAATGRNMITMEGAKVNPDGSFDFKPTKQAVDFINAFASGHAEGGTEEGLKRAMAVNVGARGEQQGAYDAAKTASEKDVAEATTAASKTKDNFFTRGVTEGMAPLAQGVGSALNLANPLLAPHLGDEFQREARVMKAGAEQASMDRPAQTVGESALEGAGGLIPTAAGIMATAPLGAAQLPALGALEGFTPEERIKGGVQGAVFQGAMAGAPKVLSTLPGAAQKAVTGAAMVGVPAFESYAAGQSPVKAIVENLPFAALPFVHGEGKTVPEGRAAISAQMEAMRNGDRDAVLITPGTPRPPIPPGYRTVNTSEGVFIYDPKAINEKTIKSKVADGTHGEILGNVAPKPEPGEPTGVVVARDAQGKEVQSAAVPPEKVPEQAAELTTQHPDATLEVGGSEKAAEVIGERLEEPVHHSQLQSRNEAGEFDGPPIERRQSERTAENDVTTARQMIKARGGGLYRLSDGTWDVWEDGKLVQHKATDVELIAGNRERVNQSVEIPGQGESANVVSTGLTSGETGAVPVAEAAPEIPRSDPVTASIKNAATEADRAEMDLPGLTPSEREAGVQEAPEFQSETGKPDRTTSVKNAVTTAERAERGLDPVEKELARGDEEVWGKAKRDVDSGVVDPDKLAKEVSRKPRPLDEDETAALLYRRTQLHSQREAQMSAAEEAIAKGDKVKAAQHNLDLTETERLLGVNEEADVRAGQKQGRAFRIRQLMAKQDFSLGAMERRARVARGGDLSVADKATIKEQHDQIAKLTTELERIKKDQEFQLTSDAVRKIVRDEKFAARGQRRATTRKALDDDFDAIKKQLAAVWKKKPDSGVHPMGLAALDPEGIATKLVLKLAKNRIQAGHVTAEGLVDAVHEKIADAVDLTKREVAEMISGYGKTSKPNDDAISRKFRELKSIIASNLGKADVLEKGIAPARRGYQRDKPTPEMRKAERELRDAMREQGVKIERSARSPEEQQKSALDRMKTVARNQIEDLDAMLKAGKRTVRGKSENIPDAELKGLQAHRDALRELVNALDDPKADDKAIDNALKAVNKTIATMEGQLAPGGDLAPKRSTVSPWSKELGERQQVAEKLRTQVREARKAAEPKPDPEQVRIDNAIAAKTRALDNIKEELRSGKKEKKGTQSSPWSPELGKVAHELTDLQKRRTDANREAAKAARAVGREQRVLDQKLKAAEKRVAETEAKITAHDNSVKARTPQPTTPALEAVREHQKVLNKILADQRAAEKKANKPAEDPFFVEARKTLAAHKALNTRLEKQATEYQRRIDEIRRTGKPYKSAPKKEPFARTSAERIIEERVQRLKQQFEADNLKASLTPFDWARRLVVGAGRAAKLTYVSTLGKLTSAATGRVVTSPVEDVIGAGVGKVFPELYESAAAEGPGSTPEAAKIASDLYKGPKGAGLLNDHIAGIERLWKSDTWREVVKKLVSGKSQQDVLYSKNAHESDFLGIPGRVHGAFKEPVRQVTFYRQFRRRLGAIAREGKLDINDPQVQMGAANEAWNDAARSIFMQRNFLSDGFNNMVAGWERSGKAGPKTAAFLARLEFPITRVPVNVVGEGLNYTFGLARALGETGYRTLAGGGKGERFSLNESFKKMTPEQKDSLMRAYKKGGLGLAMSLWGYLQPQTFGGFYQKGDKRKKDEPQPGEMNFFGHRIPSWATHIPILFPAQMGATFRRLVDYGEAKGNKDATIEAVGATAKGALSQVPFYETPGRFFSAVEGPRQFSRFVGEQARGFVPGFVQEYAKSRDKGPEGEPVRRIPQGSFKERVKQTFELGVPGLRERVPISSIFGNKVTKGSNEVQRLKLDIKGAVRQPDETPEDFKKREASDNEIVRQAIERVTSLKAYDRLTDAGKAIQIKLAKQRALNAIERPEKPEKEEVPELPPDEPTPPPKRRTGFKAALMQGAP